MTDIQKVRLLIGDNGSPQEFADSDIQAFLDITAPAPGFNSIYLACALACDVRASSISQNAQEIKIGDYSTSDRTRLAAIQQQALKFRQLEFETPAWAIVEQNLSEFNALMIIRNYILRTEPTQP